MFALTVFGGALWILHQSLREFHYNSILHQLHSLTTLQLTSALLLTTLSYLIMTGYDRLAIFYVEHPLEGGKVSLTSFISYAFSNNIGLSLLAGGSIRYRLYSTWGLSTEEIARILSFTTVTFWLGVCTAGGLVFLIDPVTIPSLLHPYINSVRPIGLCFLLLVSCYFMVIVLRRSRVQLAGWEFSLPSPRLALAQILIGTIDWILAGSVLYALLPHSASLPFFHLLGIYLLAQIVSLISHVPGGLGVFESLILLSLPTVPLDVIAGTLLVYRGIYYLLPLAIAAFLLGSIEFFRKQANVSHGLRLVIRWGTTMTPHLLAALTLVGGAILLFSGVTPGESGRMHWLYNFLPLPVLEISHFLGSLVGAGLMIVAWGLQRRLDAAYLLSIALLASGSFFSLLKGVDYEEAILLGVMLIILLPCHRHFYRRTSLLNEPFSSGWSLMILVVMSCSVWLGFFAYKHVDYSHDLWWHFAITGDAPRFLRAMVGTTTLFLLFALVKLLRPLRLAPALPGLIEIEKARKVIAKNKETIAHLALVGDKTLLFSDSGNAFLMYAVEGRSWVAMGNPIGPKEEKLELIWRFRGLCERAEGWPVFYEIGADTLYLYLDLGLTMIKLGEEARIPLPQFSLEGKARSGLRYAYRKAEKEGSSFEIIDTPQVSSLIPELQHISNMWLGSKNTSEKKFSMGCFNTEYLQFNPVAVVRNEGRIVAFTNIWQGYQKEELSVDIMRFLPEAPRSTMDYLFISLFLWGKQTEFQWFNLGMAPLAGLENRQYAPFWHRIGALIYQHGEHFYNFQGLRGYKEKFDPVWAPRYLASPGGIALPRILTNIATLISGSAKGVLGK